MIASVLLAAAGLAADLPPDSAEIYSFQAGPVAAVTDTRWFATLPADVPGAPLLELRRWPGDGVLAVYAFGPGPAGPPAIAGIAWEPGDPPRRGTLRGGAGDRTVLWIDRDAGEGVGRLGALLVPGDAGLGVEGLPDRIAEMLAVAEALTPRPDRFRAETVLPPGIPPALPSLDLPPGARDETRDPWQVAEAEDLTLGLPPGLRARRTDLGVPPPQAVPGGLLWIRGRFVDREGQAVAVGDGRRAGYVARTDGSAPWLAGKTPPLGAPAARLLAGDAYPLAAERSGRETARAERWAEPGFAGEWLVFRLGSSGNGLEIGLPVLAGRRSPALFWIPVTVRRGDEPPAPPPLDPSERFGITFETGSRLEAARRPLAEGTLTVPGLRLELPKGWWPVASLRTRDGFPVVITDREGTEQGRLSRVAPPGPPGPGDGWTALARPGQWGAARAWSRADGARLYAPKAGPAFLLEPAASAARESWARLVDSAALVRSARVAD